jgi:hypothetical protein
MTSKNLYPICANSFKKWRLTNEKYNKIYTNLGSPKPFDITLRNQLQKIKNKELNMFDYNFYSKQINLYHNICLKHKPKSIEISPFLTNNMLPLLTNTLLFRNYIEDHERNLQIELLELNGILNKKVDNFIFIQNKNIFKKIGNYVNSRELNNISLMTSVSESYHFKNTHMTIKKSEQEMYEILYNFHDEKLKRHPPFVKLYVSCINECPINGKINNNFVINRLLELNKMNIDNICLIDTCGTLNVNDFEYIVDNCNHNGLLFNKLSLQLNLKKNRKKEIEKIIHKALDRKIINFDVSLSLQNEQKNIQSLSYELYYKSLVNYIIKQKN